MARRRRQEGRGVRSLVQLSSLLRKLSERKEEARSREGRGLPPEAKLKRCRGVRRKKTTRRLLDPIDIGGKPRRRRRSETIQMGPQHPFQSRHRQISNDGDGPIGHMGR